MDSAFGFNSGKKDFDNFQKNRAESVLYFRGTKRKNFSTNDCGLYFDARDKELLEIMKFKAENKLFDSLNRKVLKDYNKFRGGYNDFLYIQYKKSILKLRKYQNDIKQGGENALNSVSILKLWNTSILAAIIIGMFSMSLVYRYLGQGAEATERNIIAEKSREIVEAEYSWTKDKEEQYINEIATYLKAEADRGFNIRAKELVDGYPIEDMIPYIIEKDPEVASFLIAIAKKESNWGKRVPVLNGKDCYNYWGYRGIRDKMGTGGHTCFNNRQDAVDTVAKRIEELIKKYGRDTAKEMVVWKCGSDCSVTGGQASANKWISDVDMYLKKLSEINN